MNKNRNLEAADDSLIRIFTLPEGPSSALKKIEIALSDNLMGFLNDNIAAIEKPLEQIEKDFQNPTIPEHSTLVSDYAENLMETVIAYSVHTAAPSFIGHMTSSLPNFLLPFSKLMVGLNQNQVKIETSKAFTPLERQVLGMMHHLVYAQDDVFYDKWMHSEGDSLGSFCSGGTIANISALWIARNRALKPQGDFKGINASGLAAALAHYGYKGLAVLISERGHYSLGKAADILGIGRDNFVSIKADADNKVDVVAMRKKATELQEQGIKILAIVGVAGTTETGSIDPLDELADLSQSIDCHFHVDAAWGGATLLSNNSRYLLKGAERSDSITIDAHKQMYVPIGSGMVLFKDPQAANVIEHHAEYILRKGSKDLGRHTLEGSRPGMAMLVHACLNIIGRQGYEKLIDSGIAKAHHFAELITQTTDFEVISEPQLCILTYRYIGQEARELLNRQDVSSQARLAVHEALNDLNMNIQKRQREQGLSFVSRTRLTPQQYERWPTVVFRVVLANPLTCEQVLNDVLIEQRKLAESDETFSAFLAKTRLKWSIGVNRC